MFKESKYSLIIARTPMFDSANKTRYFLFLFMYGLEIVLVRFFLSSDSISVEDSLGTMYIYYYYGSGSL